MKIDFKKLFSVKYYFDNDLKERGDLFKTVFLSFIFLMFASGILYGLMLTILRPKKTDSVELTLKKRLIAKASNQIFSVSLIGIIFSVFRWENAGEDYFMLMRLWLVLTILAIFVIVLYYAYQFIKVLPKKVLEIKKEMQKEMYIRGGRQNAKV